MVNIVGVPCSVLSINYTTIACNTSPSREHSGTVIVLMGSISSSCQANCNYQYSSVLNPHVDDVSPRSISGNFTRVIVTVTGFGDQLDDVAVFADDYVLEVMEVTEYNNPGSGSVAGNHAMTVVIMSKGLASGNATLNSLPVAKLTSSSGSTMGGTPLITGNGFVVGNTFVTMGGAACLIQKVEPNTVHCLTPAHREGNVSVEIQVFSEAYPTLIFNYSLADTSGVIAASPATGPNGTVITITWSRFGPDPENIFVTIDYTPYTVITVNDTEVQRIAREHAGGTFPILLYHSFKGYPSSQAQFKYELLLNGILPAEGSFCGGTILDVQGSDFDPELSQVLVCGNNCEVQRPWSISAHLCCKVPQNNTQISVR
ncbi:fibrocystin-L [Arapaima gigas]